MHQAKYRTVYGFKAFEAIDPGHMNYQVNDFLNIMQQNEIEFKVLECTTTHFPSSEQYDFACFITYSHKKKIDLPKKDKKQ